MVAFLAIGILVLGLGLLLVRWFVHADPRTLARAARIALIAVGAIGVILLLASGRFALASILVGGLLPFLMRLRAGAWGFRDVGGGGSGRQSEVSARFVRMALDHDTGVMTGIVLEGAHRGRRLDELARPELLDLLRECRAEDPQSATLIEAWLDRVDPEWRRAGERQRDAGPSDGGMSRDEAYRILGLSPGASEAEIRNAHRRLMLQNHPDKGGSTYLAAKINEAKDLLLGT